MVVVARESVLAGEHEKRQGEHAARSQGGIPAPDRRRRGDPQEDRGERGVGHDLPGRPRHGHRLVIARGNQPRAVKVPRQARERLREQEPAGEERRGRGGGCDGGVAMPPPQAQHDRNRSDGDSPGDRERELRERDDAHGRAVGGEHPRARRIGLDPRHQEEQVGQRGSVVDEYRRERAHQDEGRPRDPGLPPHPRRACGPRFEQPRGDHGPEEEHEGEGPGPVEARESEAQRTEGEHHVAAEHEPAEVRDLQRLDPGVVQAAGGVVRHEGQHDQRDHARAGRRESPPEPAADGRRAIRRRRGPTRGSRARPSRSRDRP